MLNLFGVLVFHRSMVKWRRGALVYVNSAICSNLFGVVVLHTFLVDCSRIHLPYIYVHSAIC